MNAELDHFVRDALAQRVPRERIRAELARAGWRREEVDAALEAWLESDLPVPLPRRRVQVSAREAFLYLVLFATLYVVAYHAGAVGFALVDRWLHDPLHSRLWDSGRAALRWSAASLLIAFPVFLLCSRIVGRALGRDPEKRSSGVRRWLTYLTLFLAALVLIGDLVVLVSGLLSGDLTSRFVLRALIVFAIAGLVFGHYLLDLRRDEVDAAGPRTTWLARAGAVGVLLATVASLWMVGTPARARTREMDQMRQRELLAIAEHLRATRERNQALPASLELMAGEAWGSHLRIRDPETQAVYGYEVLDTSRVRLCATFAGSDSVGPHGDQAQSFWRHGVGEHCYEFQLTGSGALVPLSPLSPPERRPTQVPRAL